MSTKPRWYTNKPKTRAAVVLVLLACAITAASLLANGFETVDVNEYGLKQNVFTKEIMGDPVRGGGLQWVGLEYGYIRFPATWQDVMFLPGDDADDIPINTQTRDGLAITFDASFQYKLKIESIKELYFNFGTEYHLQIIQVSRGALRNTASLFSATQFLQNRSGVSNAMRDGIITSLASMNIDVESFQLRAITLPLAFMDATEDVEVARLKQQIAEYELQAATIAAQQTILEARVAANVSLINAFAAANVSAIQARAQADALNITMAVEAASIATLMNATGMNVTQAIAYFYVQALEHLPEGTTLVFSDFVQLLLGV
jgi:regulator of protease activity HflC (stomatin/prohibitin superfamily)